MQESRAVRLSRLWAGPGAPFCTSKRAGNFCAVFVAQQVWWTQRAANSAFRPQRATRASGGFPWKQSIFTAFNFQTCCSRTTGGKCNERFAYPLQIRPESNSSPIADSITST